MPATTAYLSLAQAVRDLLLAEPALAGGRVSLPLRRPVPPEWAAAIEVRIGAAQLTTSYAGRTGPSTSQSTLVIDIYTRSTPGSTPDDDLDALLGAVHERLHTADLSALRVSQIGLDPRIDWDWQDGETPQAMASYQTTILHDIGSADLSP